MALGTIYVENVDNHDLFVTIIDRNTAGGDMLWNRRRLNDGENPPELNCEIDSNGEANLDWEATRADDPSYSSSGSERIEDRDTLEVYSDR